MSARRHVEASAIPADAARSAEVAQRIEQALFEDASLDAHNVLVIVSGDVLVLRGHVRSWSERSHINEIAWNTPRVCADVNDLVLFDDAAVHGRLLHGTDPMDLGAGGCDVASSTDHPPDDEPDTEITQPADMIALFRAG